MLQSQVEESDASNNTGRIFEEHDLRKTTTRWPDFQWLRGRFVKPFDHLKDKILPFESQLICRLQNL